jgi:hypothetical protein
MQFKYFITEKLLPSEYRWIVNFWKKYGSPKRFDAIFGKKDRLYLPYKGKKPNDNEVKSELEKELENILAYSEYEIENYHKGLLVNKKNKRSVKVMRVLDSFIKNLENEENIDIVSKLALGVTKVKEQRKEKIKEIENFKKKFTNDETRTLTKDISYLICISRHAYDIAGMSTDRGWDSCMTLPGDKRNPDGGVNQHLVPMEAKWGTLIAYLIREDDKNIEHPVGRMLIKPFINTSDENSVYMVPCTGGYGAVPKEFIEQVMEWSKILNKDVKFGVYKFPQEGEWDEDGLEGSNLPFTSVKHLPKVITPDLIKQVMEQGFKIINTFNGLVDNMKHYSYSNYASYFSDKPYNVALKQKLIFLHDEILKNFTEKKFLETLKKSLDDAEQVLPILTFIAKNSKIDKNDLIRKMYKEKEKAMPF